MRNNLQHRFVEFVPDHIEDGILYVSLTYCTAIHLCPCGCGNEVVTPISPTDWELIFDGKTISLSPSIGNWSLKCQSHYWVKRNEIIYASRWDKDEIQAGRKKDKKRKKKFYKNSSRNYFPSKLSDDEKGLKRFMKSLFCLKT